MLFRSAVARSNESGRTPINGDGLLLPDRPGLELCFFRPISRGCYHQTNAKRRASQLRCRSREDCASVQTSRAAAQLGGCSMAHPGLEFIQFGDFWDDRRSSYRNNFFDPYWGDRRSPHRYQVMGSRVFVPHRLTPVAALERTKCAAAGALAPSQRTARSSRAANNRIGAAEMERGC